MTKFQKFLQQRRLELGMSQACLAREIGLKSPQQLANIEGGRSPFPPRHMKRLAKVFRVRLGDLVVMRVDDFADELVSEIKES